MPCILGCIALSFPRLVIVILAIFTTYLHDAYRGPLWPILGFIFMPFTTLAYAWAWHYGGGNIQGLGLAVIIVAALMDLGTLGGGASNKRVRTVYVSRRKA